MNILHLESSPGWGGQEMRILKESEGLRERGHKIIFGCPKDSGLAKFARDRGFSIYEIDYQKRKSLSILKNLFQILKGEKISIIHTHSSLDSWLGGIAARLKSIPVIRTRHLSTPVRGGLNSYLVYNLLTDFIITTCSSIIPDLSKKSGKSCLYFRSIPTGVNPEKLLFSEGKRADFRKELQVANTDILVGTVCFMRSWKGVDDFLQAACILRDESQIKWVIIGGGHQEIYKKKAKELNAPVYFAGHLQDPAFAIAALDIFALLSTAHEGVSQSALQAAYLQKPLITTPVGGLAEICLDNETGIIVPPFSPNEVAKAVVKLKKEPSFRDILGKNGAKWVQEKFTEKNMLDEIEEILSKISKPKNYSIN